jgi:hypothetical protein
MIFRSSLTTLEFSTIVFYEFCIKIDKIMHLNKSQYADRWIFFEDVKYYPKKLINEKETINFINMYLVLFSHA